MHFGIISKLLKFSLWLEILKSDGNFEFIFAGIGENLKLRLLLFSFIRNYTAII